MRQQFIKILLLLLVYQFATAKEVTLRQMISNLVVIGFDGTNFKNSAQIAKDVKNGLGGVVIFDKDPNNSKALKNIRSPWQLKMLTKKLQKLAKNRLIIAIDQEGGKVQRLRNKNGFISTPSARDISKMGLKKAGQYYDLRFLCQKV